MMKELVSPEESQTARFFKPEMPANLLSIEQLGSLREKLEQLGIEIYQPIKVYAGRATGGASRDNLEMMTKTDTVTTAVPAFLQEEYPEVTVFVVSSRHPSTPSGEPGEKLEPPALPNTST